MLYSRQYWRLLFGLYLALQGSAQLLASEPWYPVATRADGQPFSYQPLLKARQPWRICALLPHGKDKYWWAVAWGLQQEAERQKVKLGIYQAGGYENLEAQRGQFRDCLAKRADAIILAAISSTGLNDLISAAAQQQVPVIDLVNGIDSPQLAAHSRVSFADMAAATVTYLREHHQLQNATLAWLPGPADAGWVMSGEAGLRQALGEQSQQLIHAGHAATDPSSQMHLVRQLFREHSPDFIIANAVGADVSARYIQRYRAKTKVLAYYASEPVLELIKAGEIIAAPSDSPVLQARIAIDLAVRSLEQQPLPRDVGPLIEMLDQSTLANYPLQRLLAPADTWFIRQDLPD
jgi:protein TorT